MNRGEFSWPSHGQGCRGGGSENLVLEILQRRDDSYGLGLSERADSYAGAKSNETKHLLMRILDCMRTLSFVG